MKTLLVAVDFSDASNLLVKEAGELARQLLARIVLLHVIEPKAAYVPVGDSKGVAVAAAWPLRSPKRRSDPEARLNSLADPLKAAGLKVRSVVLVGLLMDEILAQAAKYHADYIILASRGHPGAHHLVAENRFIRMLTRLTCPIIIVPVGSNG